MALRSKRPAKCHPEKTAVNKAGQCSACYNYERRTGRRAVEQLHQAIATVRTTAAAELTAAQAEIDVRKATIDELIANAQRALFESLPDAVRWLRQAAAKAAERGDSRPAETILRELELPTADGKPRRLLTPAARQYEHGAGSQAPQPIIIGVAIGQPGSRTVAAPSGQPSEQAIDAAAVVVRDVTG
jgi:hypothetical protein